MKALIVIFIVAVLGFGISSFVAYWQKIEQQQIANPTASTNIVPEQLPGLPFQLEDSLRQAQQQGPKALKEWLDHYKRSPMVKDPRLAWIELDYVLLLGRDNPLEAKRVFAEVKARTAPDSPIYPRIKSLEKTFD